MGKIDISIKDCYKSISTPSKGIYKDNGSKFLAFAFPIESQEEIKPIIQGLKKEYFDARHHCYAYRIGYDGSKWRANDDGEPASSAGRPILGQILSHDLSDIIIVVVRYFGGIKLGIPGLIRAYKESSNSAIESSTIIEKIAKERYKIEYEYLQMNSVMKIIKDMSLDIVSQNFDLNCRIELVVRLSLIDSFEKKIQDIDNIKIKKVQL